MRVPFTSKPDFGLRALPQPMYWSSNTHIFPLICISAMYLHSSRSLPSDRDQLSSLMLNSLFGTKFSAFKPESEFESKVEEQEDAHEDEFAAVEALDAVPIQNIRDMSDILEEQAADASEFQAVMIDSVKAVMDDPIVFKMLYDKVAQATEGCQLLNNNRSREVIIEDLDSDSPSLWMSVHQILDQLREVLAKLLGTVAGGRRSIFNIDEPELTSFSLNVVAMGFVTAFLSVFNIFNHVKYNNPRAAHNSLKSMVSILFTTFGSWESAVDNKVVKRFLQSYID